MRKHLIQFFDDPELCQLWKGWDRYMHDPYHRMHVELERLTLMTGAREFEINCLRVSDCHDRYIEIQKGKGDKYRTADVHPLGLPYYHAYLRERQQASGDPYLFPAVSIKRHETNKGNSKAENHRILHFKVPVPTRTIRRRWPQFCKLIHLRYVEFHGLRRTFITWIAEELSVTDMMDQVGHQDYRTTNQHYRASIPGRKFYKAKPEWKKIAEAGGQRLLENQNVISIERRR
jgi:integrase